MKKKILDIFEVPKRKRGGAPLFRPFHIFKALYIVKAEGPVGRKTLADRIDLGEGSCRGLMNHLEELNLVKQSDEGIRLSNKGTRFLNDLGFETLKLEAGFLTVDNYDIAIKLSRLADAVKDGIRERDEAMKAEASGATTLLFISGKLILPDHFDIDEAYPDLAKKIRAGLSPEDDDVIIIGTGYNEAKAEDGAFAASTGLLIHNAGL